MKKMDSISEVCSHLQGAAAHSSLSFSLFHPLKVSGDTAGLHSKGWGLGKRKQVMNITELALTLTQLLLRLASVFWVPSCH